MTLLFFNRLAIGIAGYGSDPVPGETPSFGYGGEHARNLHSPPRFSICFERASADRRWRSSSTEIPINPRLTYMGPTRNPPLLLWVGAGFGRRL
jgi:hypothetical protein